MAKRTCRNCFKYSSYYPGGGCFYAHTDDTICARGHMTRKERDKGFLNMWDANKNKYKEMDNG